MSSYKLSKYANEMISGGKKVPSLNNNDEIKKVFLSEGIPIFEKVIEFQENFGGIWFKIGVKFYHGYSMDILYFHDYKNKYQFHYHTIEDGKHFFQCMDYHYAGDIGPCIDEEGKIYDFGMGRFFIRADSIEEFLEDEAIKYYFVNNNSEWLERGAKSEDITKFREIIDLKKIERESFSDKYFGWWVDDFESVFIRVSKMSKYGRVYCKNANVLSSIYKGPMAAGTYPELTICKNSF